MKNFSQEYVASIVLILYSILQAFGIVVEKETFEGLVVGIIALWIAIRRHSKGDISIAGIRRY